LTKKIAEVQKISETNVVQQVVEKDITFDMELVGLTRKHNYTDKAIHVLRS